MNIPLLVGLGYQGYQPNANQPPIFINLGLDWVSMLINTVQTNQKGTDWFILGLS